MKPFTWQNVPDIIGLVLLAVACPYAAYRCLQKSAEPLALAAKWLITAGLIVGTIMVLRIFPTPMWPVIVVIPAMTVGIMWAPSIGAMIAGAMGGGMDGGTTELEAQPFYSIAEAKRRLNLYDEAVQLVRAELEKFPNDFPGTMLLATIQAEDMKDLPAATATLEGWMQSGAATLPGISSALTALADWHLQIAQDLPAARQALERIVQMMPDTPLAHRAMQRLAHLPTVEHLKNLHSTTTLDLRPGEKDIGLRRDFKPAAPGINPEALAESLVLQLQEHPADTQAREKLAVVYAEHFHRMDLAADQLEQLIGFPNETPKHIAQWLNLLADLHIRVGHDAAAAEAALRRILERFPNTALVDPTMARLASLLGELKAGQETQIKRLGHYEKNIGLKQTQGAAWK